MPSARRLIAVVLLAHAMMCQNALADDILPVPLPHLYEADRLIVTLYPAELQAVAAPGAAVDEAGLIGRNRDYGMMVSPRLQLGAGGALRVGLHADRRMARRAFLAIFAGTQAIADDGEVISVRPPDAPSGADLSDGDRASGAAFFLADACTGMLALQADADPDDIASSTDRAAVTAALSRAVEWLAPQADLLARIDRTAPNRLLYDALAFQACGMLSGNTIAQTLSARFVANALAQTRPDGVFIEGGGSDTTYQAVSVRLSLDLLLAGYSLPDSPDLNIAWQQGAQWLATRILPDGRIDSTANTRTCAGGESFLGSPKKVWPPNVYGALIYAGTLIPDPQLSDSAARLAIWASENPRTDPCYP